jgi:hypothetical protein
MHQPAYARRVDSSGATRAAHRVASAVACAWRVPTQRRLGLALAAAVLSAIAFARIAEDYLTNDPLARWDVSFARWLSGERSTVGTDLFGSLTFIGSPAAALASQPLSAFCSTDGGCSSKRRSFRSSSKGPSCSTSSSSFHSTGRVPNTRSSISRRTPFRAATR